MTFEGTWELQARTPVGPAASTLRLELRDGELTGTQTVLAATVPVLDGLVRGNELVWTIDLVEPVPVTLVFRAQVEGDRLEGTARSPQTGQMAFAGTRVEESR